MAARIEGGVDEGKTGITQRQFPPSHLKYNIQRDQQWHARKQPQQRGPQKLHGRTSFARGAKQILLRLYTRKYEPVSSHRLASRRVCVLARMVIISCYRVLNLGNRGFF